MRYLKIGLASLAEVGYGLHLAQRVGFLTSTQHTAPDKQMRMVAAPLYGLIRRFTKTKPRG